ncbi:MAG TPA: undecaprenyl-phosphate glucose phosphotransferase [Mucilaginibacter sp.]|nr:undecaprenyl-phosphate glucose phosphotransferase [Mucilaginibacter sp.]
MEIKNKTGFNFFRFFNDLILIGVSFYIAAEFTKKNSGVIFSLSDVGLLFFLVLGWYFSAINNRYYDNFNSQTITSELYKTLNNIFIQFCLLVLFLFAAVHLNYTRKFVIVYIASLCILMPFERIFYRRIMLFLHRKGIHKKKIIIVGAGRTGMDFFDKINKNSNLGYEVVGFLDDESKSHLNGKYLGNIEKIKQYVEIDIPDSQLDEVVVALPNSAHHKIKYIANTIRNYPIKLKIIPSYHDMMDTHFRLNVFAGYPIITVRDEPLDDIHLRAVKRAFDVVFSLFVLIFICSWLFPLIALAIKLDSPGPIFFIQERWGRKNKKIKCFKFRSMDFKSNNVDPKTGKYQQAKKNDSRITKVGRFLRKSNLDEFPQFVNVLLGNMSVVGPRPHPSSLNIESKEIIDNYMVRHLVKPGITGWAQVNGLRGATTDPALMKARVTCDIWYIENWTLLLDLKIVFLTIWNTITGDKNAF